MRNHYLSLAALSTLAMAGASSVSGGSDEPDPIYGSWMAVGGEVAGKKLKEEDAKGMWITFTPKKAIWTFGTKNGKAYDGVCRIDAKKTPKEIEWGEPNNPNPKVIVL